MKPQLDEMEMIVELALVKSLVEKLLALIENSQDQQLKLEVVKMLAAMQGMRKS